jgi:hypothetical protein
MDLKHFGDAYDIVKRSLLQWLAPFGPWVAHPMFTHAVTPEQMSALARLVGVPVASSAVLAQETNRAEYLRLDAAARSVFLDPDTGVRLHRRERHRSTEFVFAEELVAIAKDRPSGLVLVFDQSVPRGSERAQVEAKLQHLGRSGVSGFGYISQACFLALGASSQLVVEARSELLRASELPESRIVGGTPA